MCRAQTTVLKKSLHLEKATVLLGSLFDWPGFMFMFIHCHSSSVCMCVHVCVTVFILRKVISSFTVGFVSFPSGSALQLWMFVLPACLGFWSETQSCKAHWIIYFYQSFEKLCTWKVFLQAQKFGFSFLLTFRFATSLGVSNFYHTKRKTGKFYF